MKKDSAAQREPSGRRQRPSVASFPQVFYDLMPRLLKGEPFFAELESPKAAIAMRHRFYVFRRHYLDSRLENFEKALQAQCVIQDNMIEFRLIDQAPEFQTLARQLAPQLAASPVANSPAEETLAEPALPAPASAPLPLSSSDLLLQSGFGVPNE